jgi:transposase
MVNINFVKNYSKNEKFIDLFASLISKSTNNNPKNNSKNTKYSSLQYAQCIINVLSGSSSWRSFDGLINGRVLNNKHNQLIKVGVYDKLFDECHKIYFSNNLSKEVKYQSIDTTFISNKGCCDKIVTRNKYYKNKKGIKISTIVSTSGIPLGKPLLVSGTIHDSKTVNDTLDRSQLNMNTYKNRNSNRHKQIFLADKGYSSNVIEKTLRKKGYKVLIPQNRRNIKNKKLIKNMTCKDVKVYKKRIIVENFFSWIKRYPKINCVYEKTIRSYEALLLLAVSKIMFNRID